MRRLFVQSRSGGREEGSALILVVIVIFMLAVLALVVTQNSTMRSAVALERRLASEALGAAEAGIGMQLQEIVRTDGVSLSTNDAADGTTDGRFTLTYALPGGRSCTIDVTDLGRNGVDDGGGGDASEAGVVRVVSTGAVPRGGALQRRRVEAFLRTDLHPLFYKALYVGNWNGDTPYDLTFGPGDQADRTVAPPGPSPDPSWDTAAKTSNADYIEGDVHVNGGNIGVKGMTSIFGNVDASGTVSGDLVSGVKTAGAPPILPPDLSAQDYDAMADLIISSSGSSVIQSGPLAGNSPNIFHGPLASSSYVTAIAPNFDDHDRPYIHLGNSAGSIPVDSRLDGALIVVKGNLWLHETTTLTLKFPDAGAGTHFTLVVEGNLYIADDVNYGSHGGGPGNDGMLIIAKGVPGQESYTDQNGNHAWDAGEPILHDDGDGVYEGPREGSGNVYFGDPRFGTGGVTDGFIYAENNAYLTSINPNVTGFANATDAIYGVGGFLSAGNQLIMGDRTSGASYVNYRVKYDDRIATGALKFKGAPGPLGGGFDGLRVLTWRELPPP